MLPFLKPKRVGGLIIQSRAPDGQMDVDKHEEGEENHALEAVANDMLRAFSSKDSKLLASAIRSAFEILDSEPHVEGEHINETEEA